MAVNRQPRGKIVRRFGINLFGNEKFDRLLERKKNLPGRPANYRRKKLSVYGIQLNEKQKVKYMYGILERQFRRYFELASRKKGKTGENLLQILESRLDNVVYRMCFAKTRRHARQMVIHKKIKVNGEIINIPSYLLKDGDTLEIVDNFKKNIQVLDSLKRVNQNGVLPHLEVDADNCKGVFKYVPTKNDIPELSMVNEQLIVELYSK